MPMSTTTEKIERIEHLKNQPDVSLDTASTVNESLELIREDIEYLQSDDGFRRHTHDYLKKCVDDGRDVCDCISSSCPPKQGNLPYRLRDVHRFRRELDEYRMQHGNPQWVTDCLEEWDARHDRVNRVLNHVELALEHDDTTELEQVMDDVAE